MSNQKNESGFTLIEVLVSFVIISVVSITILISINSHANRIIQDSHRVYVIHKMENHLTALNAAKQLQKGIFTGQYDEKIRWRLKVDEYETRIANENRQNRSDLLEVTLVAQIIHKRTVIKEQINTLMRVKK